MTVEDIVDQYELREAIEAWVVRRLAGKLTAGQIDQLRDNLSRQEAAIRMDDMVALMHLDQEMHYLLCSYLNNREIMTTMERLRDKIHQVIVRVTNTDRSRPAESTAEHVQIVEAVISGEGEEAARLMVAHLEAGKRRILNPERFSR
jgi:DNA-binding GntR family transcriptional regulator